MDNLESSLLVAGGPGSELEKKLARFFIGTTETCYCNQRSKLMNLLGVRWCSQNIETIVDWMQGEAHTRGYPFCRWGARVVVLRAIAAYVRHAAEGADAKQWLEEAKAESAERSRRELGLGFQ